MVMRSFFLAATAVLAGTLAMPAAAAQFVVNGGFENTGFGGTSSYYNVGSNGADHAVPADFGFVVYANNVDIVANGVYGPSLASGGSYNLDLVGYGSTGGIVNYFQTRAGAHYALSFDYAENNGIDGATAMVFSGSGTEAVITGTHSWQHYTGTLIGRGGPLGADGIAFNELYGASNAGIFLDNVSVTGATIPEPASWALMVVGFGMVGFAARRAKGGVTA